jgi:hypothetical protein
MWNGLSIGLNEIPVQLPETSSNENVLVVFPSEGSIGERDDALTRQILNGRDLSLYDNFGVVDACAPLKVIDDETRECLSRRDVAETPLYTTIETKRRGYIQVGFPCADCSQFTAILSSRIRMGWSIILKLVSDDRGPRGRCLSRDAQL